MDKLATIIAGLPKPTSNLVDFDSVVVKSTLFDHDHHKQMENIVQAFNEDKETIMTPSSLFGKRITPDSFRLVALNNVPELVRPTEDKYRKKIYLSPNDNTEEIGIFKQTELFFGAYGSYVLNIPVNKIALCWKGNVPVLYGPGPHVIHDRNFRPVTEADLVDVNSQHINHGNFHIIRVYPLHIARIFINSLPYFLLPSDKPYVFNQPVFNFVDFVHMTTLYIAHGNYHILQIPRGKVAKIWKGSIPELLEARDTPYLFEDQTFRVEPYSDTETFVSSTESAIIHGSIKRLMPRTGEVALTFDSGKLVIYECPKESTPIMITNPNHSFNGFLQVNLQTLEFPSLETKKKREKEGRPIDEINYEVFRTGDGLPVGVKLLVVFEIENPLETLTKLRREAIIPHIENLVVADMGMVIQSSSSVDFLKTNQTQALAMGKEVDLMTDKPQKQFYQHLQDRVKNQLAQDFREYGIKLLRLNIETPKVLDNTISKKMAEFSLVVTEAKTKEENLERQSRIIRQTAEQEAMKLKVAQDQENANKIAQANAELQAAKLRAAGRMAEIEVEIKAQQMRAKLFDDCPKLFEIEVAKIRSEQMKKVDSMIVSPELATNYFMGMFRPYEQTKKN
jgi:regulator of protease activity HflC (stomatin/prohibitin superfamily)